MYEHRCRSWHFPGTDQTSRPVRVKTGLPRMSLVATSRMYDASPEDFTDLTDPVLGLGDPSIVQLRRVDRRAARAVEQLGLDSPTAIQRLPFDLSALED